MKKALSILGQKVDDQLKQCFTPHNQGRIARSEFQMFWSQTSNNKEAALTYLTDVANKLAPSLENPNTHHVPVEAILNTIQFITLFLEFNPKAVTVRKFMRTWYKDENTKTAEYERLTPAAKDVIRTLQLRGKKLKLDGLDDMCRHLVIICSTLHSREEFEKLADPIKFPTFLDGDIKSAESTFVFEYLRRLVLSSSNITLNLLQGMAVLFRTLPQQMKANPRVAETTLLALLHMITQFVSAQPLCAGATLLRHVQAMQDFYLWPKPFGTECRRVLDLLTTEAFVPGSALLDKFKQELNVVSVVGQDDRYGQAARAAYYFIDEKDDTSVSYAQMMEIPYVKDLPSDAGQDSHKFSSISKMAFIMSVMQEEVGLSAEATKSFKNLSVSNVDEFYDELINILQKGQSAESVEQAQETCAQAIKDLKNRIMLSSQNPDNDNAIGQPFSLIGSLAPALPPIAHLGLFLNITDTKVHQLDGSQYPLTGIKEQLVSILQIHQNKSNAEEPYVVRIILGGSDHLLHSFVCAYYFVVRVHPELFNGLKLKFYIVPFNQNHIASFLARYDSWYNRHIRVPFRSKLFLIPGVRVDHNSLSMEGQLSPPGAVMRDMISSYLRDALHEMPVSLWMVEGWKVDDDASGMKIPFALRMEIGIVPEANAFLLQEQANGNADESKLQSVEDVLNHKGFQSQFINSVPEITVTFNRVDVMGNIVQEIGNDDETKGMIIDEDVSYKTLVLSNVPLMADTGAVCSPNPADPWLEMYAFPTDQSRSKQKVRNNVLINNPQQHVGVVEIFTNSPKQSFLCRVDGRNYGPFHRIQVKRLLSADNTGMTFPVQTFFPVEP